MAKQYTRNHEWIEMAEDTGSWRVGITQYAQEQLGDIVMAELPDVGRTVVAGEECAVIESVKAASDIYAPLEGEITRINEDLAGSPELINEQAEGAGWLFEISGSLDGAVELLGEQEYADLVG